MTTSTVPSFDVVAPDGDRITIHPSTPDDRVGDLLLALRVGRGRALTVDGEPVADHVRLSSIDGLRHGTTLGLVGQDTRPACVDERGTAIEDPTSPADVERQIEVAVTSGPACTAPIELAPGRHSIGRAPCSAVVVADPAVEPHHGILDVAADGTAVFTQLAGRVPALVDGRPAERSEQLLAGAALVVGSSVLRIGRVSERRPAGGSGSVVAVPGDPWRCVVRRGPPSVDPPDEQPLAPPIEAAEYPRPPATGLIGAGVGVAGALAIATLLGQAMFALFALIGAVASLATWIGGVVTARRRTRRARVEARRSLDRFIAELESRRVGRDEAHRVRLPTIAATLAWSGGVHDGVVSTTSLWNRRVDAAAPLVASIGDGDLVGTPLLEHDGRDRMTASTRAEVERAERLVAVPVPITLARGTATAIRGGRGAPLALARSIIVQLASLSGPADWHLAIVTRRPEAWRWTEWLPHLATTSGDHAIYGLHDGESLAAACEYAADDRSILVVVDDLTALTSRTGPLRRFLGRTSAAALVLVEAAETVPSICDRTLSIGTTGNAHWEGEGALASATNLRIAGIDEPTAAGAACRLASLVDPELGAGGTGELPTDVRLDDLAGGEAAVGASAIMRRWAAGGADPRPVAAIGASIDGSVDIDLVRDGPHGLIAGTTGAGKSELLRTLVVALAANVGPDHLSFVLVDYKGGSTFDACIDLPHTVGVVTDLDDGLAERALVSLEAELRRREAALREVAAADLTDYRAKSGAVSLPRLVVVVDEFAALAKELPSFLASLVGVAQRGRSLGVHLLLATQRPSGIVSDEIRANTNLRIALRLNDSADAHDVVGDDQPSRFPRSVPGRVAMRLGPEELIVFQAARCSAPRRADAGRLRIERARAEPRGPCPNDSGAQVDTASSEQPTEVLTDQSTELRATVAAIRDAARRAGVAEPHRPWCAPLPERAAPSELSGLLGAGPRRRTPAPPAPPAVPSDVDALADAVGILDDPTHQCRRPLRWRSDAGNLALVGSLGSGTTTALLALAAVQCRTNPVDRCHLYAVDANGDASLDRLSSLAHCGAVVRARERERLARLLWRLVGEIDARASLVAPTDVRIVLLIDGLAALRASLSSVDDAPRLAELDRVLAEGPAVGVVTAFTVDATAPCASTAPAAERWLFHIDDPVIARGIAPGVAVPGDLPGRMRLASSGLAGQIAHGEDVVDGLPRRGSRTTRRGRSACGSATGAREIVTLPELVHAVDLESSSQHGARPACDAPSQHLAIGLSADDVTTASMRLPLGEHVFVGGLSHTGKSSALDRIVSAWRAVVPDGRVVLASRRRPVTHADLAAREPEPERARVGVVRPASSVACIDAAPPVLVAIDDAERVDDPHGVLRAILDGRHPNVTIAVAASLDAVRAAYGHWTRDVARSRCGLIMTASGEIDGDLLGVTLPRRSLIAARPGLAWLVDGSGHRLVQIAIDR